MSDAVSAGDFVVLVVVVVEGVVELDEDSWR